MSKLFIVESPAKAKTISRILGSGYVVEASYGHVRDLPGSASEVPAEYKGKKWAKFGVDVDNRFQPLYIVSPGSEKHVSRLRAAAKSADEIILATDGDREGESISWHLLELLKPKKSVQVSRVVYSEITPEAIKNALNNKRAINDDLVRAQETRRIVDRLYGYSLSPVLWKRVAPKLSAGRVQSVAVRLTVLRERERRRFHSAEYWDLSTILKVDQGEFKADLVRIDAKKVATGASFDPETGKLKDDSRWLNSLEAQGLAPAAFEARPWIVSALETRPDQSKPPVPFRTSTLQQEAGRKLGFNTNRTMQIAQTLYEGIDLQGERVGLITYMRTDSSNLSDQALNQSRAVIESLYGKEYLPDKPVRYGKKAPGAQEAHEAIRPTDLSRRPQDVRSYLTDEQYRLYDLIWKRTIASQMVAARLLRTTAEIEVTVDRATLTFQATGKQIEFPGYLRAYVEGTDDPEAELGDDEKVLPPMVKGQQAVPIRVDAVEHHTRPPARYTEASLIKKLEEEGIGRPSTYGSIIATILNRDYVFKRGNELVPTFTAFAVIELLENHFGELVDTRFTAKMESELDEIADGERDWVSYLQAFYFGNPEHPGLQPEIAAKEDNIPYPSIPLGVDPASGLEICVRVGRFGTFVQRGEGGAGHRATIPDDIPPADLTLERALNLLSGPEALGKDPATGQCVFLRKGRFGPFLEVKQTDEEIARGETPKRVSLPAGVKAENLEEEDVQLLLRFPREIGLHPDTGEPVVAQIGKYGPYVKSGETIRNVTDWRTAAQMPLADAVHLLAQPKELRRRAASAPAAPLKEFGKLEGADGPVKVLDGRYGPYVTDGKTNATLPKGIVPAELTAERAIELLQAKAAAGPSAKRGASRGGTRTKSKKATTTRRAR